MSDNKIVAREIDKTSPDYIWSRIWLYCRTNHITRDELSKRIEISKATISTYNKDASNLSYETVHKFCRQFNFKTIKDLAEY